MPAPLAGDEAEGVVIDGRPAAVGVDHGAFLDASDADDAALNALEEWCRLAAVISLRHRFHWDPLLTVATQASRSAHPSKAARLSSGALSAPALPGDRPGYEAPAQKPGVVGAAGIEHARLARRDPVLAVF